MPNSDELLEHRNRLADEMMAQGHEIGDWESCMDGEGYQTRCLRCGGFIGVGLHGERGRGRKDNRLGVVMHDPFTSLGYCPAGDAALMKQLNDEWGRRLANVAKILIELGRSETEKRLTEEAQMPGGQPGREPDSPSPLTPHTPSTPHPHNG